AIILVFSLLLVAEIELFALKFKSFGWRGNELRFAFLGIALILIVVLNKSSLPAIILLYVLLSLAANWGLVGRKE
ncbi:MAG: hypothetical protein EBR30_26130, partial [Cytophagia bacterium]|nr:hypothetical protein [Cytophagia bacterium]